MKQVNLLLMSAAMTLAACGGTKDAGQAGAPLIERSDIQIEGKPGTDFSYPKTGWLCPITVFSKGPNVR